MITKLKTIDILDNSLLLLISLITTLYTLTKLYKLINISKMDCNTPKISLNQNKIKPSFKKANL